MTEQNIPNVLRENEPGFGESSSLWNTRFGRQPDLVVKCEDEGEVAKAVDFAKEKGHSLSIMGGGHSYAAHTVADGGLLIDISAMKSVTIDPDRKVAVVRGPITCGELDRAAQDHGLATPLPTVSSVGVIGAALGGGSGYLSRRFGLTLDNVISARVATADGRLLTASSEENPDLFWAIRGGGGNFGIVTELELQLHNVGPEVLAGQVIYPFGRAGDHLRFFREFMADAPDDFQCYPFCFRVPPIDIFPEETHGSPVLDFVFMHQDLDATGRIDELRHLDEPILDAVGPTPYLEAQTAFDANLPKGQRYMSKAENLDVLSDSAIDVMIEYVPQMVGPLTAAYFEPLGGAIGRVDRADTAYWGRGTSYGFHIIAGWMDPADDREVAGWANDFQAAMKPHSNGGVYVNLIADDEPDRVPAAYGGNLARLIELKRTWDPTNLFDNNYNIAP